MSLRKAALVAGVALGALGYAWLKEADVPAESGQEARAGERRTRAHRAPETILAEAPHPVGPAPASPDRDEPIPATDVRTELQRGAHLVQVAREALAKRDLPAVEILLSYAQANANLVSPPDALALERAADCMHAPDEEARGAAASFLRDEYASVLRKDVRRVCFAETN